MKSKAVWLAFALICTQIHGQDSLPVEMVLTDTEGRRIVGTILAIHNETVSFRRASDDKEFEIQIGTLSEDDRELITWLATKAPAPVPVEEPKAEKPATRVVLDLPFEEQDRGGICAAAATLNILKFLDPGLKMSQEELLALFNDRRSGASPTQVALGIETLGFTGTLVETRGSERDLLIEDIKRSIDAKQPMIAATSGHAMVLMGYDITDEKNPKFFVWNQRSSTQKVEGMPPGTEEMSRGELFARIRHIMFIRPKLAVELPTVKPQMELYFTYHTVVNANRQKETNEEFLEHAAEPAIHTHLRRGNRVFIVTVKNRKSTWLEITEIANNKWTMKNTTTEEETTTHTRAFARLLATSNSSSFFSGSLTKPKPNTKPD